MKYIEIKVPDMNDSFSRTSLGKTPYRVRFTYNSTGDYWTFGLYSDADEAIAIGMKVIPGIPVNLFFGRKEMPKGAFVCVSKKKRVGRNAFIDGEAAFLFFPTEE